MDTAKQQMANNIKPKVFCYFVNLNNSFSSESIELISLWEKSWSDHGWDPIVLTRQDAMQHELYNQDLWNSDSNIIFKSNPDCPLYTRTCYERWFAYSVVANRDGLITWADYDVINYGYHANEAISECCSFDAPFCCGVLSSKTANEIIQSIVKYAFIDKETFASLKLPENNDMCLISKLKIFKTNFICLSPTNGNKYLGNWKDYKLNHFHGGVKYALNIDKSKTRLEIIERLRPYEQN